MIKSACDKVTGEISESHISINSFRIFRSFNVLISAKGISKLSDKHEILEETIEELIESLIRVQHIDTTLFPLLVNFK